MSNITKAKSERPVAENVQHQLLQLLDIQVKRVELSYSGKDISSDVGGIVAMGVGKTKRNIFRLEQMYN